MNDRSPLYPGRVTLTPVAGETNKYDMTMADEPTQEGTPPTKANLLDDTTQALIGLSDNEATVNMALHRLVLPVGKYAAIVTVLTPGGRPISGVTVTGISSASGASCVTDADGKTIGFTSSASPTLSVSPGYADASNLSKSVTLIADAANLVTMQLTRAATASKLFTSSGSCKFSPDVSKFNCSAIGGGGNGGTGVYNSGASPYYAGGGSGGGAGGVTNQAGVTPTNTVSAVVGAAGGTSSVTMDGETIITAAGGSNGNSGTSTGAAGGIGGATGGAGGYATSAPAGGSPSNGGSSSGFLYPPTSVGGAGGGGTAFLAVMLSYGGNVASGGSAGGGTGGYTSNISGNPPPLVAPTAGSTYGSGGGGGSGNYVSSQNGASGHSGAVGFTWSYKGNV